MQRSCAGTAAAEVSSGVSSELDHAETLLDLRRPQEAERRARAALAGDPTSGRALSTLVRALLAQERNEDAVHVARALVAAAPDAELSHRLLSVALRGQGDADAAVHAATRSVQLAPTGYLPHYALGLAYSAASRPQEALRAAEEAARLAPADAGPHILRGSAYADLGRRDDARRAYEHALALEPGNAVATNNLAALDMNRGRLGRALPLMTSALGSDPQSVLFQRNFDLLLLHLVQRLSRITLAFAVVLAALVALHAAAPVRAAVGVVLLVVDGALVGRVLRRLPRGTRRALPRLLRATGFAHSLQFVLLTVASAAFLAMAFLPDSIARHADGLTARLGFWALVGAGVAAVRRSRHRSPRRR